MSPHAGQSRDGLPKGAVVMAGRVVDVDPLRWTCRVRTEILDKNLYDVQVGGPYLHPLGGEGIYAMPEIGALVWICKPSEGDAPWFIVGYRAYPSRVVANSSDGGKPSAAGLRPRLAPGDMAILGRERNGVYVRRGQLTEVLGGPLARTIYVGRSATVHTICQTSKLDTFGGSVRWEVDRAEADPDGHQRTRLDLKVKEFADDRSYVARLQVGGGLEASTEGEPDGGVGTSGAAPASTEVVESPVLHLRVYQDGDREETDLSEAASVCLDKDGQVELAARGTVVVEIRGAKNVTLKLNPDGTVELDADTTVTTTVGGLAVTHSAGSVSVGGGRAPVLLDAGFSASAAAAWATVSTMAKLLGVPTAPLDAHAAALSAGTYTALRLESD